jgi:hypothetical protein
VDNLGRHVRSFHGFSDVQLEAIDSWAGAVHMRASDNDDVKVPPAPTVLLDYLPFGVWPNTIREVLRERMCPNCKHPAILIPPPTVALPRLCLQCTMRDASSTEIENVAKVVAEIVAEGKRREAAAERDGEDWRHQIADALDVDYLQHGWDEILETATEAGAVSRGVAVLAANHGHAATKGRAALLRLDRNYEACASEAKLMAGRIRGIEERIAVAKLIAGSDSSLAGTLAWIETGTNPRIITP